MRGHVDPERRLRCLSLGTYAQAIVERLAHPPGERMDDLQDLIGETFVALKAIEENRWPTSSASGLRPFRYYDQVKVLKAQPDAGSARTGSIMAALEILQEEPNVDDADVLEDAMRFFRDLACEALRQSHCSIDEAVTGLRA